MTRYFVLIRFHWLGCRLSLQYLSVAVFFALVAGANQTSFAQQTCDSTKVRSAPDSRYEVVIGATPEGSEVLDKTTRIIWQRCVLGMNWNGSTCVGTPRAMDWNQAQVSARTMSPSTAANPTQWLLPASDSLFKLVERACMNPAINSTWFPATPAKWFWSADSVPDSIANAWVVGYEGGFGGTANKSSNLGYVRLIRLGL